MSINPFKKADFLIPKDADLQKWAVIACDQYTSDPEYWKKAREARGDAPSAINLILPEAELTGDESFVNERAGEIRRRFNEYLGGDLMAEYPDCYIYVERTLKNGRTRCGILGAVDLEQYEPSRYAETLVRPSEGTVFERVPPRVTVREKSPAEVSHLVLFADDAEKQLIEPLAAKKGEFEKLYDFDLPEHGGHVAGWKISAEEAERIDGVLSAMAEKKYVSDKYGTDPDAAPLLLVVADGNHSLVAAKEAYDKLKSKLTDAEAAEHPARYAMAELVNIHSDAFEFEPIYRVVKGVDVDKFLGALRDATSASGEGQKVTFYYAGGSGEAVFTEPSTAVTAGTLQRFIDDYIDDHGEGKCDYIHGEEELKALCKEDGAVGFIFDGISKEGLFRDIITGGILPRKAFSIGAADDKRFYLEARRTTVPVKLITARDSIAEAAVAYDSDIFCKFNLFHINVRGKRSTRNLMYSIGLVIAGLVVAALQVVPQLKSEEGFKLSLSLVFAVGMIVIGAFWAPLMDRMMKKQLLMHWETQTQLHTLVNIIRVSPEGVYVFSDNGTDTTETYLSFDQISKVYETDDAFYIYFTYNNAVLLNKADIEKGSPDAIRELFIEKLGNKFSDKYFKGKQAK
ncbi:MAG: DUF1015 family protein [Clostridia bacterium]|nr:DUF1015 family protein [Clostridia bacterium]